MFANDEIAKAYKAQLETLRAQMAELTKLVEAHANSKETKNYGHVGDLAYVNEQIGNAIGFLTGDDR